MDLVKLGVRLTSPLENILEATLNKTLHGRSRYRIKSVTQHNVVKGYSTPGKGDGLDLFRPAGEAVKAMHSGVITRVAETNGPLSVLYIEGKAKNGSRVTTVYAHVSMKPWVKVGAAVYEGRVIGYVGRKLRKPHLHLEVWINGKPITSSTAEGYWEKLKSILAL